MDGEERAIRQAFIRQLVAALQCVSCGEKYSHNDIYVLGHHEDMWVSAVVCTRCGTQGLVFATLREGDKFEPAKLEIEELAALQQLPPLSVNDVLDMHAFLKSFEGDVHDLFRQGRHQDD